MENNQSEMLRANTRRHFFKQAGFGIGAAGVDEPVEQVAVRRHDHQYRHQKPPMFPAKAKSVIYLFMAGAPSQVDLLDASRQLQKYDGQSVPEELMKGERFAFIKGTPKLLGSPYRIHTRGNPAPRFRQSAAPLLRIADDVSHRQVGPYHSVQSRSGADLHEYGLSDYRTAEHGFVDDVRSWEASQDLPGFVVLLSGESQPDGGKGCWGSGFLPTFYQGVEFRSQGDPVLFLSNPDGVRNRSAPRSLDLSEELE